MSHALLQRIVVLSRPQKACDLQIGILQHGFGAAQLDGVVVPLEEREQQRNHRLDQPVVRGLCRRRRRAVAVPCLHAALEEPGRVHTVLLVSFGGALAGRNS